MEYCNVFDGFHSPATWFQKLEAFVVKFRYWKSIYPKRVTSVMQISKEDERPDVVMTVHDKDDINKFSAHLARRNELRSRIARKKKLIQVHEDAADELIIMDDEAEVYYNVGDVFIMDDKPSVESVLEKTKDDFSEEISTYEDELKILEKEMVTLKASLYAKFGKTINLEE